MTAANWVISTENAGGAKCTRCGAEIGLRLPMPVPVWCAAMKAFLALHKRCKEPADAKPTTKKARP